MRLLFSAGREAQMALRSDLPGHGPAPELSGICVKSPKVVDPE
jgi:hypothetical protein